MSSTATQTQATNKSHDALHLEQPIINRVTTAPVDNAMPQKSLRECTQLALHHYYASLEGQKPSDVYAMVMKQIEPSLLETTLIFVHGNQSKAAILLGLSRGTLRKKLKQYQIDSHGFASKRYAVNDH